MKTKFIAVIALMLVVGAFIFPVSAFAADTPDTTPPTVTASITGNNLRIEAKDDTGVEAVYIDGKRFNYRVDSILNVDARDCAGSGETISVYAVDFAGNKSETATVKNPLYAAPVTTPSATPSTTPAPTQPAQTTQPAETPQPATTSAPAQSNPFTPSGQASVQDQATQSDGKDFYTFTTPDGNVFYLVIDHQKNGDNVYFLNAVNEDDLAALAEKSKKSSTVTPVNPAPTQPTPTTPTTPEPTEQPAKSGGGNSGTMIFLVIALLVAGGAGYYFKILRPKQQKAGAVDDEEIEDDGEEMEFEDEPDEGAEMHSGADDGDPDTEDGEE